MELRKAWAAALLIDSAAAMKRNGFTMADRDALWDVLNELKAHKMSRFVQSSVKTFLESHGIEVTENGCGYCASVE